MTDEEQKLERAVLEDAIRQYDRLPDWQKAYYKEVFKRAEERTARILGPEVMNRQT